MLTELPGLDAQRCRTALTKSEDMVAGTKSFPKPQNIGSAQSTVAASESQSGDFELMKGLAAAIFATCTNVQSLQL